MWMYKWSGWTYIIVNKNIFSIFFQGGGGLSSLLPQPKNLVVEGDRAAPAAIHPNQNAPGRIAEGDPSKVTGSFWKQSIPVRHQSGCEVSSDAASQTNGRGWRGKWWWTRSRELLFPSGKLSTSCDVSKPAFSAVRSLAAPSIRCGGRPTGLRS